jgi:hypothetical protein
MYIDLMWCIYKYLIKYKSKLIPCRDQGCMKPKIRICHNGEYQVPVPLARKRAIPFIIEQFDFSLGSALFLKFRWVFRRYLCTMNYYVQTLLTDANTTIMWLACLLYAVCSRRSSLSHFLYIHGYQLIDEREILIVILDGGSYRKVFVINTSLECLKVPLICYSI